MPPLSPRMQQLQGGMSQGPDQATELFEQGLSEMAYQLLTQRMPDLIPDVVTFKVLSTDVDKGYGVGAFVVSHGNSPVYVPVVMSNNAIKPLEVMYHKALNTFLPLNKGWLDEMDKAQLSTLGMGVKTPDTLYTDVDIRNIVVPPITGRFSYAGWHNKASFDAGRTLSVANLEKTAADHTDGYREMLLPLLTSAPNKVKVAFQRVLEKNPALFKFAASIYGVTNIAQALRLRLEKTAAKQLTGGALWIVDKDNTPTDFKRIFGDRAAEAYAGVRKSGFASKDDRLERNMAVQEQPYTTWTEPNQPGVYVLCDTKGTEDGAFVMPNPVDLFDHERTRYGRRPSVPGRNPLTKNSYTDPSHGSSNKVYPHGRPDESQYTLHRGWNASPYLAVFGNGDYLCTSKLVGRPSIADEVQGNLHKRLFVDVDGTPRSGKGFFVRQKGTTFQATVPVEIKSISTDGDGVRRITASPPDSFGGNEVVLCTDPKNAYNSVWMPKGSDVVYLPPDFIWVPLKTKLNERAWFQSALDLAACASSMLASVGAKKVAIKDAGARQFSIDGGQAMSFVPALKKLASEHVLAVDVAQALLVKAASTKHVVAWVASPVQLAEAQLRFDKIAADDDDKKKKSDSPDKSKKKSPPSGGPSGPGGQGGPPSQDGMDDPNLGADAAQAAMGPPPAPPPPAPLDLAAMEMDQAIQHEMQKLMERQQTIQQLLQRSNEIGGGAPVAPMVQSQAMGAPPPSMNLATGGAPTMAPSPMGGQPGMGMGADMGAGGPFPPAANDPSMMGGAPPGMDPMGGAGSGGPGMDPSMGGMPPTAPGMDPSMGQMDPSTAMAGQGQDPSMGGMPPSNAMMPPEGPNAGSLQSEINPQFLGQAAQLNSADAFDAAAIALLAQSPELHSVVGQYLPNLEKSVDNLARVMLTLWMQESDLKERVGEETFDGLEQALQATFKGMGDLVLRLARGVQGAKDPEPHAAV